MTCPNCEYENLVGTQICTRCGELLIEASGTKIIIDEKDNGTSDPKYGSIRLKHRLILQVLESNAQFVFNKDEIEEVIIGRENPDTGEAPPIALDSVNGLERGVSRNHAIIVRRDNALHIKDNNSSNGTYLNGQRLVADNLRVLRDGDDIRVGTVTLRINFD
ncbi:MAG: hypothetical protein Phog2KO_42850 [Phototrophicaceae bacterium]